MTNYLLRNIDPVLWDKVKHLAIDRKLSLRELLLEILKNTVEGIKK